jgi:APA family basic amino acid/polyamine antiporter
MRKIRFIRGLSFFDSVMLGIGFIIGSGIFIMPLLMAQQAGTFSLLAWVLAGIYSILTAFCFAEAAAKLPKAGGLYSYAHQAFGDFVGFIAGWTFWIGYWITIATEIWAIGYYLQFFLPQVALLTRVFIAAIIGLILSLINYRGVRISGDVEDAFTIGKLVPLLIFIAVGLFFIQPQNYFPILPQNVSPIPALGSATVLALWAFLGAEIITVPEEEIKNARKSVPKAILIAATTVIGIYLLVSVVFLGINWQRFAASESPLADAFKAITSGYIGGWGGIIIAVGALISIIGALNAVILGSARISFAMSRDKLFPKFFSKLHPKHKTPYVGIIVQTIFALVLAFSLTDFTQLANLAVMFTIIPYTISCLAVLRLIKKSKGEIIILESRVIPLLAVFISLALLTQFSDFVKIFGSAFVLIGILFFVFRKKLLKK